jgi:UDP-glucose 4-epimerase
MRVLITGGAGLVGRATARALQRAGHDVAVADIAPMPDSHADISMIALDILRKADFEILIDDLRPSAIIHLAAQHFIPICNSAPAETLRLNVEGTQRVLDAARSSGVATILFASSAAVYAPSLEPLSENSPLMPDDIYGSTKVFAEQLLRLASADATLRCGVMRLFNVIGSGDPNAHLIPRIVEQLRVGGAVELGNLDSTRDYVFVDDVADAFVLALEKSRESLAIFNVGSGRGHSVRDVISTIESLMGTTIEVCSVPHLQRAVDRPILTADISHTRRALGWEPRVPFRSALSYILEDAGVARR